MTELVRAGLRAAVEREGFRSRRARLGRQAGCERLGISLFELEPGSAAFPLHYHLGNEEMLIVLSGDAGAADRRTASASSTEGEVVALPGRRGRAPTRWSTAARARRGS